MKKIQNIYLFWSDCGWKVLMGGSVETVALIYGLNYRRNPAFNGFSRTLLLYSLLQNSHLFREGP